MHIAYTELHCISNFSFLRGASHTEELIARALALEYAGLAITDECSFAGSARAHLALKELSEEDAPAARFQLIHGTELQLVHGDSGLCWGSTSTEGQLSRNDEGHVKGKAN